MSIGDDGGTCIAGYPRGDRITPGAADCGMCMGETLLASIGTIVLVGYAAEDGITAAAAAERGVGIGVLLGADGIGEDMPAVAQACTPANPAALAAGVTALELFAEAVAGVLPPE